MLVCDDELVWRMMYITSSHAVYLLQMLLNEYREFAAKIDELNEVGSAYDASLKGLEISTTAIARSKLQIYVICRTTNLTYWTVFYCDTLVFTCLHVGLSLSLFFGVAHAPFACQR